MSETTEKFIHIWRKYRPAILSLMIKAQDGDQAYALSDHEFQDINNRKTGYSFKLQYHKGESVSGPIKSLTARDLFGVLKASEKARELSQEGIYEFELDRKFVLHLRYEPVMTPSE